MSGALVCTEQLDTGLEKLDLHPHPDKLIVSLKLDTEHAQSTSEHSDVAQTAGPRAQIST